MAALSLGLAACGRGPAVAKPLAVPPEAGALYSLSDNEGGFRAGKVLATEDEVVFMLLHSERWTKRPSLALARKAAIAISSAVPIAFSKQTFAGMQPMRLETGQVSADELEPYETWKQSKRETF